MFVRSLSFQKLFTGWRKKRVVLSTAELQCLPKFCSQKYFSVFVCSGSTAQH